jgi:hypothetical protein
MQWQVPVTCWMAQEPDQSFDVLCRGRQVHSQLLNKLALTADDRQIANQQNAQLQIWIDGFFNTHSPNHSSTEKGELRSNGMHDDVQIRVPQRSGREECSFIGPMVSPGPYCAYDLCSAAARVPLFLAQKRPDFSLFCSRCRAGKCMKESAVGKGRYPLRRAQG